MTAPVVLRYVVVVRVFSPVPELLRSDVALQALRRRTAVITGLGREVADGISVEVPLEVVARSPEVLFGDAPAGYEGVLVDIWRGRYVRTREVVGVQDFRYDLSGEAVLVRVAPDVSARPVVALVDLVVSRPEDYGSVIAETSDYLFDLALNLAQ